jgi:hypothetical protein
MDELDHEFISETIRAKKTLDESLEVAHSLWANLPEDSEIRTTSILIGAGFELVFDVFLTFRFGSNFNPNKLMITKKRAMVVELGILNEMYNWDLEQIFDIRNHCAHSIEIDEKFIKMKLNGTKTYNLNIELMKGKTLGHQLRQVSLLIHNTIRTIFAHFVTNHLNDLLGWK